MEEENYLKNIKKGQKVEILTKSKKLVTGYVEELASRTEFHRHGIMVMLTNRQVGRVQRILSDLPESKIRPSSSFFRQIFHNGWSENNLSWHHQSNKLYRQHTLKSIASLQFIKKSLLPKSGENLK